MALNVPGLATDLINGARDTAGDDWQKIVGAATIEMRALAQKVALIVKGCLTGELSKESAEGHFAVARFHVIATIAMLSHMIRATVEKILNGALAKIRDAVNTAIGFALI